MDSIASSPVLSVRCASVGSLGTNVYYIFARKSNTVVVIDAPQPADEVVRNVGNSTPTLLLITHGHRDHIGGAQDVARKFNLPIGVSKYDMPANTDLGRLDVGDGTELEIGGGMPILKCLHTPGHTAGSTCYYLAPAAGLPNGLLFSGDTLFPGGPGRTPSPAMFRQILKSITSKLLTLEDSCLVLPGHGASTTIGAARAEYAVFERSFGGGDMQGDVRWQN